MGFDYEVDTAVLRDVADGIRRQHGDLRAVRRVPAPRPNAGESTGELGHALSRVHAALGDLANLCAYLADNLDDSADSYEHTDSDVAAELHRIANRAW